MFRLVFPSLYFLVWISPICIFPNCIFPIYISRLVFSDLYFLGFILNLFSGLDFLVRIFRLIFPRLYLFDVYCSNLYLWIVFSEFNFCSICIFLCVFVGFVFILFFDQHFPIYIFDCSFRLLWIVFSDLYFWCVFSELNFPRCIISICIFRFVFSDLYLFNVHFPIAQHFANCVFSVPTHTKIRLTKCCILGRFHKEARGDGARNATLSLNARLSVFLYIRNLLQY